MKTKQKGSIAEMAIASDLTKRGFAVALPVSECSDWDLLFDRGLGRIERVQVKYAESTADGLLLIRTRSHSVVAGKVASTKTYSKTSVDWIGAYDGATGRCFYIPIDQVEGREEFRLRLTMPPRANRDRVHLADDYATLDFLVA